MARLGAQVILPPQSSSLPAAPGREDTKTVHSKYKLPGSQNAPRSGQGTQSTISVAKNDLMCWEATVLASCSVCLLFLVLQAQKAKVSSPTGTFQAQGAGKLK